METQSSVVIFLQGIETLGNKRDLICASRLLVHYLPLAVALVHWLISGLTVQNHAYPVPEFPTNCS